MNRKAIEKQVITFVRNNFPKNRLISLLLYGSSLNESGIPPKDYDFLLLLDKYRPDDYPILRKAKIELPIIELFVDYWDQINRRGFENYQRGRHGSYFVPCLAASKCLIGRNVYLLNLGKIPIASIKRDLLYRLEEYFYRIQKHYINDISASEDTMQTIKKYISKICMDLLLYSGELSFNDVHKYHYTDIVNIYAMESEAFPPGLKKMLRTFFARDGSIELAPLIISQLYDVYLKYFEENKDKSLRFHLSRGRYKNIVFEYSLIKKQNKPMAIVLLDGLPSIPSKKELISELNSRGYDVFFPRYEGTWESDGEFLNCNPVLVIDEFIKQLNKGIVLNHQEADKRYCAQNISVFGSSFGGGIALSLPDCNYIKKVCAISPIISFKQIKGIKTLENYVSNFYPGAYRFKAKNWRLMINDKLFCPLSKTFVNDKKVLIISGELDNQIPIAYLLSYCKSKKIKLEVMKDKEHITLSKIDATILNLLDKFMKC